MGRPRKRRREGEADAPAEQPTTTQDGSDNSLNGFTTQPSFSSLGLISPPEFADVPHANEVYAQAQLDPSLVGIYGPSPVMTSLDFTHTPPIDPSLWAMQAPNTQPSYEPVQQSTPPSQSPCTCLSLTYLTLTSLQTVPSFSFPQVILPLRKAMSTIAALLHCAVCPLDPFSAVQNTSSLAALFKALVERFSKVLQEVDSEAERLAMSGERKKYRIGDSNPALAHLHTGTLDCPMGFNVDLEPGMWKTLVKTALRTEVHGGGSNPMPLVALVEAAEDRQRRWHTDKDFLGEERRRMWGSREECEDERGSCENLGAEHVRRAMGMLKWE